MKQQLSPRPIRRRTTHGTLHKPQQRKTNPFLNAFKTTNKPWWRSQYCLVAGWGAVALGMLLNVGTYFQADAAATEKDNCQKIVQSSAVLSRDQLGKILTVPERSNQKMVRDIVAEPYCQLPSLELRDGVAATREAYPLAFEPSTWLVMLYEGDEYAGFSFSFQ